MVETLFFDTEFYYRFKACGPEYELNIPIKIPFIGTVEEMVFRIITMFKIPAYTAQEMRQKLSDFINVNTKLHFDNINEKLLSDSRQNVNDVTSSWEAFFKEGSTIYSDHNVETDEEVFAFAYHRLVHSSALETMLQLEHRYALGIRECIEKQNEEIDSLTSRQTSEMAEAVEGLDVTTSEQKINRLAIRHFEDHSLLQAKWFSELNTIKEVQKREYREWVMEMLEQQTKVSLRQSPLTASLPLFEAEKSFLSENVQEEPILEESFTIHLGSQLKQMHNIRLLSADVDTFLKINVDISSSHQASQRLQTAMALYSNDLCALVFLTDNAMGFSNVTKDFVNTCQQSTEFHFPHIDDQLESIADCAKNTQLYRKIHFKYDKHHSDWQTVLKKNLSTGDVFITRHSNLAKVHLIYHIIVDDTLRSADINSRHPVILGLRNILKMACSNNITTLTIPLLLQHDMTEEMTVSWCTKRAELVFKCVKGFMIEMASWGGSELKNLQFLVPKGISQSVFSTLSTMLPGIFKLSNPVVFKAIQSKNS